MFNFLKNLFGTKKEKVKKPHSLFYEEGEKDLDVNEIFKKMRPHLESFAVECIGIKTKEVKDLDLKSSKFGGLPFFPVNEPYPRDEYGNEMILLAQLNFAEIPHIAPYPKVGLLQFFMTKKDNDYYGINFDKQTEQSNWKAYWWESTDFEPRRDLGAEYMEHEEYASPILKGPLKLEFFKQKNLPVMPCLEYHNQIEPLFSGDYEMDLVELQYCSYSPKGHRIGGFPHFTQDDLRNYQDEYVDYKLLFQIDSERAKIMWGDMGVGLFFIKEEDLLKRDFTKVMFHYDCG